MRPEDKARRNYMLEMVGKFRENPRLISDFLRQERVPRRYRKELQSHLTSICIMRGLGHFISLDRRADRDAYLQQLADMFEAEPMDPRTFMSDQGVHPHMRGQLESILKTISLIQSAGKILRGVAGIEHAS